MKKKRRKQTKMPKTMPRKKQRERKRRDKTQKKRLIALGLQEDLVNKMSSRQVKDLLKRPAKIKAAA